jgi:hypothetical protein
LPRLAMLRTVYNPLTQLAPPRRVASLSGPCPRATRPPASTGERRARTDQSAPERAQRAGRRASTCWKFRTRRNDSQWFTITAKENVDENNGERRYVLIGFPYFKVRFQDLMLASRGLCAIGGNDATWVVRIDEFRCAGREQSGVDPLDRTAIPGARRAERRAASPVGRRGNRPLAAARAPRRVVHGEPRLLGYSGALRWPAHPLQPALRVRLFTRVARGLP